MQHDTELIQFYLDVFLGGLTTPLGVISLLAALVMIAATFGVKSSRWVYLTLALYIATLPLVDASSTRYTVLAPILQQLRQFCRPLIFFFLVLLIPTLVSTETGWRRRFVYLPLILFFVFQLSIATRMTVYGGWVRGTLSLASYTLVFATLGYAVSRWMQSIEDLHKAMWALSSACGLVVLGTAYQLLVNRSSILMGNRLTGVTSNPQFFGIFIAYTLPITCYLLSRGTGRKWLKLLLVSQIAVTVVMLMWTGSRTGALSAAIGLSVAFHRRLGRFIVIGIVMFVVVLLVLPYFEGSSEMASRLLWTVNTRESVWQNLIVDFKENLWFGAARDTFESRESTYLVIFAQFGIFGSIPFYLAAGALAFQLLQIQRLRRFLGNDQAVVDTVCGVWAAIAVASAFEAILLGVITFPVLALYVTSAATAFLSDWCQASAASERVVGYEDNQLLAA